jgi:hypothetical protein
VPIQDSYQQNISSSGKLIAALLVCLGGMLTLICPMIRELR